MSAPIRPEHENAAALWLVTNDAAWTQLVLHTERPRNETLTSALGQLLADTEAPLRARIAELERERDEARASAVNWRNQMRYLRDRVVGEVSALVEKANNERVVDAVRRAMEEARGLEAPHSPEAPDDETGTQEREDAVSPPRAVGADGIGLGEDPSVTQGELVALRSDYADAIRALRGVRPRYGHFCPVLYDEARYGHTDACAEAERVLSTERAKEVPDGA